MLTFLTRSWVIKSLYDFMKLPQSRQGGISALLQPRHTGFPLCSNKQGEFKLKIYVYSLLGSNTPQLAALKG